MSDYDPPDNPAAFPRPGSTWTEFGYRDKDNAECSADSQSGMTLRDYFAGQALPNVFTQVASVHGIYNLDDISRRCYKLADALLRERKKPIRYVPASVKDTEG